MPLLTLSTCPICASNDLKQHSTVKDHSISKEAFDLTQCNNCHFLFTNPQPEATDLWKYYESENYVSHSKSTKGFINYWYRQVQKLNLRLKFDAIHPHVPRGTWLDYGAGAGDFVKFISRKRIKIVGLEPSETARKSAEINGVQLSDTSALNSISKSTLACITMWHVLEHIPNFKEVLIKLIPLLESNGILVIAVPNHASYDSKKYKENWAALDVPRHLWHLTERDIRNLSAHLNLELISTKGMIFDSLYVSLLSEKYIGGSKISGILTGIKSNFIAAQKKAPYSSQIYILTKKAI